MFNTLLNDNVLRIIRIKCVIRIIRNTRIKQLSLIKYKCLNFHSPIYLHNTLQLQKEINPDRTLRSGTTNNLYIKILEVATGLNSRPEPGPA